jgi:hypothetical protein
VEDHGAQERRQVRGLGALCGAAGRARCRAGVRRGERADAGGTLCPRYKLALSVGNVGDRCAAYEEPMRVQMTAVMPGTITVVDA